MKVSSKHLAPWGFPRLRIGGLSVWDWTNDGHFMPLAYHPRSSITWLWATYVYRGQPYPSERHGMGGSRSFGMFGWALRVSWQERMPRRKHHDE